MQHVCSAAVRSARAAAIDAATHTHTQAILTRPMALRPHWLVSPVEGPVEGREGALVAGQAEDRAEALRALVTLCCLLANS